MSEIRWNQVMQDITKVEYKYNIKNPLWDSQGWEGVFKEYGFVPVDAKGEWWTRIPGSPEIPIIYAPLVTTSATTAGAIAGTSSTALIETATPIIDVAYTEIAGGGSVATVTTGGAVTSVSSAVATGAAGAAIGFGVGVASFEAAPEFWTKISNAVFGTDLDPSEIGQMTRDTNALAIIKEGICYLAEDMINAIRRAFFDNGAADTVSSFGTAETSIITVNTLGNMGSYWGYIDSFLGTTQCINDGTQAWYNEIRSYTGYGDAKGVIKSSGEKYVDVFINMNNSVFTNIDELPHDYEFTSDTIYKKTANSNSAFAGANNNNNANIRISQDASYGYKLKITRLSYSSNKRIVIGYDRLDNGTFRFGTVNGIERPKVDSITPTGEQGTKEQPLSTVFPNWTSKAIETIAGDGETKVRWLPVSLPSNNPLVNGNSFTTDEAQDGILPDDETETLGQIAENTQKVTSTAPNYPTPPIPPEPTITPTPNPPILSGAASIGLANLYNPTLTQLKEFSRWLWGADFDLNQLKKLFQDPMQAIIGLHVLYATPTTGTEKGIQLGYINSGVNSRTVTEQYIDIDCGTVTINEYFGDARDYSPFTQTFCYLPFIGIVELNADDVINSNLTIKYRIDVLTGCCLAQLTVKKFGLDAVLYTYTGNCAIQMPITSGSYLSTITSLLGAVVGVVGGALTGGVAGAVAGGVYGASNIQKASVSMSGSLGSNAGAMGIRKPYIIIKRVEEADANGYNEFYGYPTNRRALLSDLSGFVRVKDINLSGVTATAEEQAEIITLLKEGVII